jgi:glycosyltransferase involved in cell wall biosynthesis
LFLCYFLIAQVLLFIQLFGYLLLGKVKGRQSTVLINTMLPFGAAVASKLLAKKIIYYVHETYIQPEALKRFLRFFIEHCASHVIFVSQYLSQQEAFKKPMQNVIYNGLRSDFSVNNNLDFVAKFAGKKLFFAGSLKRYKGIEKLVELARVLPDFNVIAALNCQPSELDRFKAEVEPPNNMTFIIRPANIQQYFASSFLVLNLSSVDHCVETFGLSLIEGMAFATPVIAPPIGGPTEFVTKKNGALISAEQVDEIVKFIRHLNSSEKVWRSYANDAYLTAKSFSAEQYKQSFKSYFEQHNLL